MEYLKFNFPMFVCVFLLTAPSVTHANFTYITMAQNYDKLMTLYNTYSIGANFTPVDNISNAMVIEAKMKMYAIGDYDEVGGSIEIAASLELFWMDEIVQIINTLPYNVTYTVGSTDKENTLIVPHTSIWTPQLILYSAVGTSFSVGHSSFMCRYSIVNGRVAWNPRTLIKSACSADITYYPFDRQTCIISFVVWGHTNDDIEFIATESEWDLTSYEESGEWTVVSTSSYTEVFDQQSILQQKLTIERKPLYFSFNIIFPVVVLCLLNGMVFWLPVDAGERVGFSITCFLSFVVLLNTIMDFLPRTSAPMSYLCYYLVIMMTMSGIVTAVVILEIRLYYKDDDKEPVPSWLKSVIHFISRYLFCKNRRCCRNDVGNSSTADLESEVAKSTGKGEVIEPMRTRFSTKSTNENNTLVSGTPGSSVSEEDSDNVTWKDAVAGLDKFFFVCFIGLQAFYSVSYLIPLVNRV